MIGCLMRLKFSLNLNNIVVETKSLCNILLNDNRRYSGTRPFIEVSSKLVINKPFTMKLDSPQFKACITEEVIKLNSLFESNGYELRIVGGAVRDLLLGFIPKDLDFSTTATPSQMREMFIKNEIRLINVGGEKHGTVTSRINDKNFEITSLRIDRATDGRHALVEYTKDWAIDANRRDLTVNAMYLGLDGTLYDYFNGYEDLKNRKLNFVGDATRRIQEDYLRILRYFRFYGIIAEGPDCFNEDILKAIYENKEGLGSISGERIWVELNKILTGNFVAEIMLKMISVGICPFIGLPSNPNVTEFKRVTNTLKMKDVKAKPVTLLTALLNSEIEAEELFLRIKPSKLERELCYFLMSRRAEKISADNLKYFKVLYLDNKFGKDSVNELLKYLGKIDLMEELKSWKPPLFPVNGQMLKERGLYGREIGQALLQLKQIWCQHDFSLSVEELLERVPNKKVKHS